jgi:hypothetical protein
MKKLPSKVAHNRPPTFFFNTGPAAQTAQKQKSRTPKSPLMQVWVFRLGSSPNNLLQSIVGQKQGKGFLFCEQNNLGIQN